MRDTQGVIFDESVGNVGIDGVFGPQTERLVEDLQRLFEMTIDGVVALACGGSSTTSPERDRVRSSPAFERARIATSGRWTDMSSDERPALEHIAASECRCSLWARR